MRGSDIQKGLLRKPHCLVYTGATTLDRGFMKKLSRMLALLLIGIASVLQAMNSFANPSGAPANTKFSNLEDQFVKESLALSPVSAS
jgi:hypothetical protein